MIYSSYRSPKHTMANAFIWLLGLAFLLTVGWLAKRADDSLGNPAIWTGYSLFGLFVVLAAFNLRKKLSMVPLGRAFWWHQVHIIGGVIAVGLYLLHVENLWPEAGYERVLAGLVYLVLATGIAGYFFQTVIPVKLTRGQGEIIFERIPDALAETREEVQALIVEATEQLNSETLARFYQESLDWYLRKPRFVFNQLLGGRLAGYWIKNHFNTLRRYTNSAENKYVARIEALAVNKSIIDLQYAQQGALKLWLLVHVPSAAAVLLFIFWHLLLVNIYSI